MQARIDAFQSGLHAYALPTNVQLCIGQVSFSGMQRTLTELSTAAEEALTRARANALDHDERFVVAETFSVSDPMPRQQAASASRAGTMATGTYLPRPFIGDDLSGTRLARSESLIP